MNILNPAWAARAMTATDQPVPQAKRYVYHAGADTLSPIYRDPSLTETMPNPAKAGPDGAFALCYLMDGVYDVVIHDTAGAELQRFDGVTVRSGLSATAAIGFGTLDALLQNATLGLESAASLYRMWPGDLIEVTEGGFRYRVADAAASDHHLTTAAGLKLRVEPEPGGLWNLAAFGADLTGATDATAAVQMAMDAATGGGTVYHPGGVIQCLGVEGRPGINLRGTGRGSVLARGPVDGTGTGSNIIAWATGMASDIHVSDLAFDLRTDSTLSGAHLDQGSSGDFKNALKFDDFSENLSPMTEAEVAARKNDISVSRCHFFNSNHASAGNWTLTALSARGINDLLVTGNICHGVQIKLAGSSASSFRLICSGNTIHDPQAYAISAVVKQGSDTTTRYLEDVTIQGNIAHGNGTRAPAYYTGADDGEGSNVICRNILISGNQGHMNWSDSEGANFAFVKHRGGTVMADKNISITGNNFTTTGDATGIACVGVDTGGVGISIRDNLIDADLGKAAISAPQNSEVSGNILRGANRGIEFTATGDGTIKAVGNMLDGQGLNAPRFVVDAGAHQLSLHFVANTLRDCLVLSTDFAIQPFSFKCDGGAISGLVAANTVVDLGNTAHSIDENNQGGASFAIVYAYNIFEPASLFKRRQTDLGLLCGNQGGNAARGALQGAQDFTQPVTLRAHIQFKEGIAAPAGEAGYAAIYVDGADGDLKVKFGDGTVRVLATPS